MGAVKTLHLLLLLTVGLGCSKTDWSNPGPQDVFEQFLLDLSQRENERAFAAITPEDRDALTRALASLDVPEAVRPQPHEMLVVAGVDSPYEIKRIEVEPRLDAPPAPGTRVRLKLTFAGPREAEAFMVWDGTNWFVDLPLEAT